MTLCTYIFLDSRINLFNRNLQQMVSLAWLLHTERGTVSWHCGSPFQQLVQGSICNQSQRLGSDAHISLSLSASYLLFSKALPRRSGSSFVSLKSPVHFLGTQLLVEWFKNRRKMSVFQLTPTSCPMCLWPLAYGHHLLC